MSWDIFDMNKDVATFFQNITGRLRKYITITFSSFNFEKYVGVSCIELKVKFKVNVIDQIDRWSHLISLII